MNNDHIMNDGQKPAPEEMDFLAAGREARRVTGSDAAEWENRSYGSRRRGPAGRYQGLRGSKSSHQSKAPAHENKQEEPAPFPGEEETTAPAPEPEITRAPAEETDLEVLLDSEPVQAPSAEDPEESELLRALMEDPFIKKNFMINC